MSTFLLGLAGGFCIGNAIISAGRKKFMGMAIHFVCGVIIITAIAMIGTSP